VHFDDAAKLYISIEQFFRAGNCPVSSLDRLIRDFDLIVDRRIISAPFPFCSPDRPDAQAFLHAVMSLSIPEHHLRTWPEGGSC
jgi:hypothetical protein